MVDGLVPVPASNRDWGWAGVQHRLSVGNPPPHMDPKVLCLFSG